MYDLSVIIIGRNEEFFGITVEDVLKNIRGKTEIIAIVDGYDIPVPPIPTDPRLKLIKNEVSIGQRAAINQAVKLSTAKYVMKTDAHVAFDEGFDVKMVETFKETGDNVTMIPTLYNLHAYDWKCKKCGVQWYQGLIPDHCKVMEGKHQINNPNCDNTTDFEKVIVWKPRLNRKSEYYRFDTTLHFQYHGDRKRLPSASDDIVETMSAQGSCFMLTREKYWELNICDENWGSWGQQGTEVACKTWLSGGRLVTNRKTWYSHMFRTQGGSFGFPYPISSKQQENTRKISREVFFNNKWEKQVLPLSWLIDKFKPLPDWHEENGKMVLDMVNKKGKEFEMGIPSQPTKGIVYYTDSQLDSKIAEPVRQTLKKISNEKGIPIVCSSLKKMNFGDKNIHFPSMRKGYLAMFKQILAALENSAADIIFFTEHDVLYHPSHFDFTPPDKNTYYYNQNVWFLRLPDGHALHYDVNQLSGLCAYRDVLITHFRERYEMVKQEFEKGLPEADFVKYVRNIGFEPMTHNRIDWKNKFKVETWKSEYPNVDIKHGANATGQRWNKDQYRNHSLLINWTESEEIQGWGKGTDIVKTLQ